MRAIAAMVALSLAALGCSTAKSRKEVERDYARDLTPTGLLAESSTMTKTLAPRALKIRLWADQEHRRSTVGWQIRAYHQIEAASQVLEEQLHARLEVIEARDWDHDSHLGTLNADLLALEAQDPGQDVDLVIGLVTALPVVTTSMHELGMARLSGRHLVLRAMDDLAEAQALAEALHTLGPEERERVYRLRLRHKEQALLLHELGHIFGAQHSESEASLMHPNYSQHMVAFDPVSLAQVVKGLAMPRRRPGPSECDRLVHSAPKEPATLEACQKELEIRPEDPSPALFLAACRLAQDDLRGAER
jgi:predicted Zn-dependent protease